MWRWAFVLAVVVAVVGGAGAGATPPPAQNGRIMFSQNGNPGGLDIYAVNSDGKLAALTSTMTAEEYWSAPSPNGMQVAYVQITKRSDGLPIDNLFVMRADGGHQRQLTFYTDPSEQAWQPVWTPDGASIVFTHATADANDVWSINADGSNAHQLFFVPYALQGIDVSPDGTRIVYSRLTPGIGYGLYIHRLDGSVPDQQITGDSNRYDLHPKWSPDGSKVVVDGLFSGLSVVNADGTNRVSLTADGGAPSWSPDGTKIVFDAPAPSTSELFTINADGSGRTQMTSLGASPYGVALPSWSPRPLAASRIDALLAFIGTLPPGSSLAQKVGNAQAAYEDGAGNWDNTCNKLAATANEATSEAGTTLTSSQADAVLNQVNQIRSLMQC